MLPTRLNGAIKVITAGLVMVYAGFSWGVSGGWQWPLLGLLALVAAGQWLWGWDRSVSHSSKLQQPLLTALFALVVAVLLMSSGLYSQPLWGALALLACHLLLGSQPQRRSDESAE